VSQREPNQATGKPVAVMQVPARAAAVCDEIISSEQARPNSTSRFLDPEGLASHLGVPKSWIYDRTGPSCGDRIPHFKMGKYIRFDIQSEEFKAWLKRNFRY
jgi:hypothetical protein